MMNEKELFKLKEEIEDAKSEAAKLQGKKQILRQQLKDAGCESVKEAKREVNRLEKEMDELQIQINKTTEKLEEEYNG